MPSKLILGARSPVRLSEVIRLRRANIAPIVTELWQKTSQIPSIVFIFSEHQRNISSKSNLGITHKFQIQQPEKPQLYIKSTFQM